MILENVDLFTIYFVYL